MEIKGLKFIAQRSLWPNYKDTMIGFYKPFNLTLCVLFNRGEEEEAMSKLKVRLQRAYNHIHGE